MGKDQGSSWVRGWSPSVKRTGGSPCLVKHMPKGGGSGATNCPITTTNDPHELSPLAPSTQYCNNVELAIEKMARRQTSAVHLGTPCWALPSSPIGGPPALRKMSAFHSSASRECPKNTPPDSCPNHIPIQAAGCQTPQAANCRSTSHRSLGRDSGV